jgi:hypothetical protein
MTTTTTRLDQVISNQRKLFLGNVAAAVVFMSSFGASIVAMF